MDELAAKFSDLIQGLEEVRDAVSAEQAHAGFDQTTLQVFWRKWPGLAAWTGSLWRLLSDELAGPGSPHLDHELDEVGGSE
jgi:hypothetical protein